MIRLQKAISQTGVMSRRKAEEAISEGRVTVNGEIVSEFGSKVDPKRDEIRIDGNRLEQPSEDVIIAFHKPTAVITSRSDPQGRKTVLDFLPEELQLLRPVGRLDYDSEGLLLLTNSGRFSNQVAHPRYGVRKIYHVWVTGNPSRATLAALVQGLKLRDGLGRFEKVAKIAFTEKKACLEVEVSEGRNRFIRRMFEAVDHPVVRLKRTQIGQCQLGKLPQGKFRFIQEEDVIPSKKK